MAPLLASGRSDRAFERMYRKHVHDVYRYALGMLRNPADAEDVTQTTFMNAYRAFERGERPRQPQNWLMTIAHNVCRQRFRNASRRPTETEWDDALAAPTPDDDDGPSIADVQRALEHLPFNQRSALVMRELEGRTYAEIAEVLELSVSAVETLLFRARRALREQLEGALTCGEAERSISRQLDGALPREERGRLRAHLRECKECARDARRLRAQRAALKGLGAVPLPTSLISWFGGGSAAAAGGAAAGAGIAAKAAAVVAAGAIVAGAGHEVVTARDKPVAAPAPASAEETGAGGTRAAAAPAWAASDPRGTALATPVRARAHGDGPPSHATARGLAKPPKERARGRSETVVGVPAGPKAERERRKAAEARGPKARNLLKPDASSRGTSGSAKANPKAAERLRPIGVSAPRAKRDSAGPPRAAPVTARPEETAPKPGGDEAPEQSAGEDSPATPVLEQAKETLRKLEEKVPPVPPARELEPPVPPKVKIP